MNDDRTLERSITSTYEGMAPSREPNGLLDDILLTTSHTRQRPNWLALIKEPPMRISQNLAVGSPTVRVAAIMVATLLIAIMVAGAGVAGSRLLAANGTIVVDQNGNVPTINEAIEMAEDGDIILVKPGIYQESIALTGNITIQGDGAPEDVVIEFDEISPTAEADLWDTDRIPYGVRLDQSDATLSGLTIRGPASGFGIRISGGAPIIDGVTIDLAEPVSGQNDDANAPLWFGDGSTATITNSSWSGYVGIRKASPTIEANTIDGYLSIDGPGSATVRANRFVGDDNGVGMSFGGSTLVEANEFENGGVSADTGADPTIVDNIFQSSGDGSNCLGCAAISIEQYPWSPESDGVSTEDFEPGDLFEITAVVRGNQVNGAATAIKVQGIGAAPVVRNNTIEDSQTAIIVSSGAAPSLEGNQVQGGSVGIVVSSNGSPTLTGNTVENVSGRGIALGARSNATLVGNTSCNNGTNLWQADDLDPLPADGNEICEDVVVE